MWPLVAAAAATAAANYMQSQQANKANQGQIDAMMDRLDGVQLPTLNESDYSYSGLDPRALAYQDYQYGGDYAPDESQFVRENDPTLVERSQNAKFGRDAQMDALKKFRSNVESGYDPEFAAKMDQASQRSQGDAQSRMSSILQDAQRRGQLGSNAMLAAQMQGSSDAMNRGAMQSQQAAVESYKNQLQQQRDAASLGGQVASADEQLAAQNAGITNSFNERTSRAYQQHLDQANEMANQAKLRNLNSRQSIGNQNVGLHNQQVGDQYKASQAERSYQNQLAQERQGVRQSNFNNQMAKATGQNSIGGQQMNQTNQNAMMNMGAIQGIGQGIAGYYQNDDAKETMAQNQKWQGEQNQLNRDAYTDYRSRNGGQ